MIRRFIYQKKPVYTHPILDNIEALGNIDVFAT